MNIYVGNLPYTISEDNLRKAFAAFGTVVSVRIVNDRETGKPRGFAFVEMGSKAEGEAAIAGLDGKDLAGRTLSIKEAMPRDARPPRRDSNSRY